MRASRTEYISGRNWRVEVREGQHSRRAAISNHDRHYNFHLDLEAGVYTASRIAVKPRPTGLTQSGRTRHIHTETVDTGERREIFGYTARRVITRATETSERAGTSIGSESEVDGWYIDPPAAWLRLHPPNQRAYPSHPEISSGCCNYLGTTLIRLAIALYCACRC